MTGQDAAKRVTLDLTLMLTDVHRYGCECARQGHEMDCVPTRQMVAELFDAAVAEAIQEERRTHVCRVPLVEGVVKPHFGFMEDE